jgi:alpha-tubulin suppressor-like RCC1 family protein
MNRTKGIASSKRIRSRRPGYRACSMFAGIVLILSGFAGIILGAQPAGALSNSRSSSRAISARITPATSSANGMTWSEPVGTGADAPNTSVSCPGIDYLCLASDTHGNVETSTNEGGSWETTSVDPGNDLESISCAEDPSRFCAAVGTDNTLWTWDGNSWSETDSQDGGMTAVSCETSNFHPGYTTPAFCVAVSSTGTEVSYDGTSWSTPQSIDAGSDLTSVSCPGPLSGFCIAVDNQGNFVSYNGTSWSTPQPIDAGSDLTSVSCAASDFCVAVDNQGNGLVYNGSMWSSSNIDPVDPDITSVSCPVFSFCTAVDSGGNVISFNGSSWAAPSNIDSSALTSISCPMPTFCIAVDVQGNAYAGTMTAPTNPISWSTPNKIDTGNVFQAVSCVDTTYCAAVDSAGNVFTTSDSGSTWTDDSVYPGNRLTGISCPTVGFCMAVGVNGTVWASTNAFTQTPTWTPDMIEASNHTFDSVSCVSVSWCAAVDGDNDGFIYNSGNWSSQETVGPGLAGYASVSCVSTSYCLAVGDGSAVTYTGGDSWNPALIFAGDPNLRSDSCVINTTSGAPQCVAVDGGNSFTYDGSSWSYLDFDGPNPVQSISCPTVSLCEAIDVYGGAYTYDGNTGTWSAATGTDTGPTGLSCPTASFCVEVDNVGSVLIGTHTIKDPSTTVSTVSSDSTVTFGVSISDVATVTGDAAYGSPTQSVNFYICGPTDSPEPCSNENSQVGGSVEVAAGPNNTSTASSASYTPDAAGEWCFAAVYGGDLDYAASSDTSPDACIDVTPAPTTTNSTPGSNTIALGKSVTDSATVSGSVTSTPPTGRVSFYECGPNVTSCTTSGTLYDTESLAGSSNPEAVTSTPFSPTSAGKWCFAAVYEGDSNYQSSSDTSTGECVDVTQAGSNCEIVAYSGNNQESQVSQEFANPLVAQLTGCTLDTNVSITFTAPSPSGASGSFNAAGTEQTFTATTVSGGLATVPLYADTVAGTYNVTATYTNASGSEISLPGGFSLSNISSSAASVWGWGTSAGDGPGNTLPAPASTNVNRSQLSANDPIQQVSSGSDGTTLALSTFGSVYAWGNNSFGQLGLHTASFAATVTKVDVTTSVGTPPTLSTTSSSSGSGLNSSGAFSADLVGATVSGNGVNSEAKVTSVTAGTASTPSSLTLSAGAHFTGTETITFGGVDSSEYPVEVPVPGDVIEIAEGGNFSLALNSDHDVYAWGYASDGAMGRASSCPVGGGQSSCNGIDSCDTSASGDTANECQNIPVQVDTSTISSPPNNGTPDYVEHIAAEGNTGLLLTGMGAVWAWGDDQYGQVGIGTGPSSGNACNDDCYDTPQQVTSLSGSVVSAISGGNNYALALTSQGFVFAWGDNSFGQLGGDVPVGASCTQTEYGSCGYDQYNSGTTSSPTLTAFPATITGAPCDTFCSTVPVQIAALNPVENSSGTTEVTAISAGYDSALAMWSSGTVSAWGDDTYGELATGMAPSLTSANACSSNPASSSSSDFCDNDVSQVSLSESAAGIAAGDNFDLVTSTSGQVDSWGIVAGPNASFDDLGNSQGGNACPISNTGGTTIETCQDSPGTVALPAVTACTTAMVATVGGCLPGTSISGGSGQGAAIVSASTPSGTLPCDQSSTNPHCFEVPSNPGSYSEANNGASCPGGSTGTAWGTASSGDTSYCIGDGCAGTSSGAQDPDATQQLFNWLYTLPEGTPTDPVEVQFAPGGCYEIDGSLFLRGFTDYIFDGNGATFTQGDAALGITAGQSPPGAPVIALPNWNDSPTYQSAQGAVEDPYCGDENGGDPSGVTSQNNPGQTALSSENNTTNGFVIMWFVEGGCDLEFENMTVNGYSDTHNGNTEQDSAFETAGAQRVLITGTTINDVLGDCFTPTGLHEAATPYEYPSSDVTIQGNTCTGTGRDGVGPVYENRLTIDDNTFNDIYVDGIDLESDGGNPAGGEGNLLVENNTFKYLGPQSSNDGGYLLGGITLGQVFQLELANNTVNELRISLYPQQSSAEATQNEAPPPGHDFTVENNTALHYTTHPTATGASGFYQSDWNMFGVVGSLFSGNAMPLCVASLDTTYKCGDSKNIYTASFVDPAAYPNVYSPEAPSADIEVDNNNLNGDDKGLYSGFSSADVPILGATSSETSCGNTTDVAGQTPHIDGACNSASQWTPLPADAAVFPDFSDLTSDSQISLAERLSKKSQPVVGRTVVLPQASGSSSDITCSTLSGAFDFDPPLSPSTDSASEMALLSLRISGCENSSKAKLKLTGTGSLALPVETSNCSSLAPSDTPFSLAIDWSGSGAKIAGTEIVFSGYTTTATGIQLGGTSAGVTVEGKLNMSVPPAACASASSPVTSTTVSGSIETPFVDFISAPDAPYNVTSKAGPASGQATVSWSAPNYEGQIPVTLYTATASPLGRKCTSVKSTSCTISGLTQGRTYDFTVTASNVVGTSLPSESSSVFTIPGLVWAGPTAVDSGHSLTSVSCPTSNFCGAVDSRGDFLTYNGSAWSSPSVVAPGNSLTGVSCTSSSFCAAVDNQGNEYTYNGSVWSAPTANDGYVTSVSCVSSSFCIAVGGYGNETLYNGTSWSAPTQVDTESSDDLYSVSCVSPSFCAAVDVSGHALAYNGTSWSSPQLLDSSGGLQSVSCASDTFCDAISTDGTVYTFSGNSWTGGSNIDPSGTPLSVSCASQSFCAVVDTVGQATTYDGSIWLTPLSIDPSSNLSSVSCPTTKFCAAVDRSGNVFIGT